MSFQHTEATRTTSSREGARSEALLFVGLRRVRHIGRLIYWTARHRSLTSARWVLAFEGTTWN